MKKYYALYDKQLEGFKPLMSFETFSKALYEAVYYISQNSNDNDTDCFYDNSFVSQLALLEQFGYEIRDVNKMTNDTINKEFDMLNVQNQAVKLFDEEYDIDGTAIKQHIFQNYTVDINLFGDLLDSIFEEVQCKETLYKIFAQFAETVEEDELLMRELKLKK